MLQFQFQPLLYTGKNYHCQQHWYEAGISRNLQMEHYIFLPESNQSPMRRHYVNNSKSDVYNTVIDHQNQANSTNCQLNYSGTVTFETGNSHYAKIYDSEKYKGCRKHLLSKLMPHWLADDMSNPIATHIIIRSHTEFNLATMKPYNSTYFLHIQTIHQHLLVLYDHKETANKAHVRLNCNSLNENISKYTIAVIYIPIKKEKKSNFEFKIPFPITTLC